VQPGRSIRERDKDKGNQLTNFDISVECPRSEHSSVPVPPPAEPPSLAPFARYTSTSGVHRTKWRKPLMLFGKMMLHVLTRVTRSAREPSLPLSGARPLGNGEPIVMARDSEFS